MSEETKDKIEAAIWVALLLGGIAGAIAIFTAVTLFAPYGPGVAIGLTIAFVIAVPLYFSALKTIRRVGRDFIN